MSLVEVNFIIPKYSVRKIKAENMICHIPTTYLEAETKLPPVLTHTHRKIFIPDHLVLCALGSWGGGVEKRLAGILTNLISERKL